MALTMNTVNQVPKGTVLYVQNSQVESISLVVKGRVLVYNSGTKIICGPGSFLGVSDLLEGKYAASYYVMEDASVLPIAAISMDEMEQILENKVEYRGSVVSALSRQIVELYKVYITLSKGAASLKNFMKNCYNTYQEIGKKHSMPISKLPAVENLPELEL